MNRYNIKDVLNKLSDSGVPYFDVSKKYQTFFIRCPKCGDSRKSKTHAHLKVMLLEDRFKCYRCGKFYGSVWKLFEALNLDMPSKKYISDSFINDIVNNKYSNKEEKLLDNFLGKKAISKDYIDSSVMDIFLLRKLLEFKASFFYKKAIDYMCNTRGFKRDFIESNTDKFIVGSNGDLVTKIDSYNPIRKTFGRINFISSNNIFIQGRSYLDTIRKKYYIYHKNLGNKDERESVPDVIFFKTQNDSILLIVEGPFDAFRLYSLGISSISVQGVRGSNLVNAIKTFNNLGEEISGFREYCVLLDSDVSQEKLSTFCDELRSCDIFDNLFIAGLPSSIKDPGDISSFNDIKNIISGKKPYSNILKLSKAFNNMLGR